jgi:predicted phage tail protein
MFNKVILSILLVTSTAAFATPANNSASIIDGEKIQHLDQLNINKKPNQIDLIPTICGSGPAIFAVGALLAGGASTTAGAAILGSAAAAQFAVSAGLMIASIGLQMMLAPKPEMQRPESTVSGAKQSFLISSKANLTEQGSPVPVGYGRLRVGSSVIQSTIKSYPQTYDVAASLTSDDDNGGSAIVTKTKGQ